MIEYKTFPELAAQWLFAQAHLTESSRDRYRFAIDSLGKFFSSLNGGLAADVGKWQIIRRNEVKPATFNIELQLLRTILDYGLAHGRPKVNPASEIRQQRVLKKEVFVPSREEYQRIVAHITPQLCGLKASRYLRILATSGMRRSELDALRWRDIDFERDTVTIGAEGNCKNGKARTIPMFRDLRAVLEELAKESTDAEGLVIGHMDLRYWVAEACRALGLPTMRAHHGFRSYFVTQCLQAGVDVATVAKFTGHQDGGMLVLKTYNTLSDATLTDGAAKINARG